MPWPCLLTPCVEKVALYKLGSSEKVKTKFPPSPTKPFGIALEFVSFEIHLFKNGHAQQTTTEE